MIKPRDTIIHYNDMHTKLWYPADGTIFPQHYYERLFQEEAEPDDFYHYGYMSSNVHSLYKIVDKVLIELSNREPVYRKAHMRTEEDTATPEAGELVH